MIIGRKKTFSIRYSSYISVSDPRLTNEDIRQIADQIGCGVCSVMIFSYSLSSKQILDELKKIFVGQEFLH